MVGNAHPTRIALLQLVQDMSLRLADYAASNIWKKHIVMFPFPCSLFPVPCSLCFLGGEVFLGLLIPFDVNGDTDEFCRDAIYRVFTGLYLCQGFCETV